MENPTIGHDIDSLNQNILKIDLDDLAVDAMEKRIELTLATLLGGDLWDGPGDPNEPCSQFSCSMYF